MNYFTLKVHFSLVLHSQIYICVCIYGQNCITHYFHAERQSKSRSLLQSDSSTEMQ